MAGGLRDRRVAGQGAEHRRPRGEGAAQRTYLELGRRVGGERIIVESGLETDDRLVTSNVQALRPGAKVEAQASGDQAASERPAGGAGSPP